MLVRVIALGSMLALPRVPLEGAEGPCRGLEPPTPRVDVTADPGGDPPIRNASRAEIRQRVGATRGDDGGNPELITSGLTAVELAHEFVYTLARVTKPDGTACVALDSVQARIANRNMTVFVLDRYGEGSCEREAILDHEFEHVEINRDVVRIAGERLRAQLEALASRWRGRWLTMDGEATIRTEIENTVEKVLDAVREQAAARHAELDTPQSYARTQGRCDGW
mgnify:CR=1 FL=1